MDVQSLPVDSFPKGGSLSTGPILYEELASWWPLVSAPSEYAEAAALYAGLLQQHGRPSPQTLLELGSGGGNNASHLKHVFSSVTLVDRSAGMLEVSRALNPECEHQMGDMRSVRLGRQFDCVFVQDAIGYATTLDELRAVVETMFLHCRPGGALVLAPDFVKETFQTTTEHGGRDGEGRGLRYLAWTRDPDPSDTTYVVDFAFLLRRADGTTEVRQDQHVQGLFSTSEWLEILEETGFTPHAVPVQHSDVPFGSVVFVASRLPESTRSK